MSTFYKLAVQEVKRETPQAVSVSFYLPEALQSLYQFKAGQYLNLKLSIDGVEIRRAYSICVPPDSGELRIAVKAVKNGLFSNFANQQLKAGHVIEVGIPEGKFTFEPMKDRLYNYAAFVAGSGITPVMSILKTVLEHETLSTFVLVYGNKSPEETIFKEELTALEHQFVGRFFVHYVFSQTKVESSVFGRIDKSTVNFILKNKHKELTFSKFYLCGPEDMINAVSQTLTEQNVAEEDIKFELFSASGTEKQIQTSEGHSKISVVLDGEETFFEMSPKQTLLEAALKQGLDAPYSCQGGICSSCLARVTQGTAEMKKNAILTDSELASGLILTCQAHPTSGEISIDYDDV
jgi:ring-1,2-phenylacetyl-CoA epoxidase subunit PaaE